MRVLLRIRKRTLVVAAAILAALAVAVPVLADYTGPDRVVSTFVWERKVCDYEAVYDPPGPGWWGCTLTLYEPPDDGCPSNVAGYFTPSSCGWPQAFCQNPGCDISRSSSIDGCNQGQTGCRQVERQTSLPEAKIAGSIACAAPGSGSWCRGGGALELSGSEPVAGESILAVEGTHNGATFACTGSSCTVGLNEGANDFTFWAISSFGDTSRMGSAAAGQDSQAPAVSGSASGNPGDNGWYISDVTVDASASDNTSGLARFEVQINGGGWSSFGGAFTLGDGSYSIELRAVDAAGNSTTEGLSVDVDTSEPFVDLDAVPSFCPGCGETADVTINVLDGGSGIASWSLTASGATVAGGSGDSSQTVAWDGAGLGAGTHSLDLEARDGAGHSASTSFSIGIIAPTPRPREKRADNDDGEKDEPRGRSFAAPTLTPTPLEHPPPEEVLVPDLAGSPPSPTILPTATARTVTFGALPVSPAEDGSASPGVPAAGPPTAAPGSSANVFYGAAALAVIAGATAVAAENLRRRRAEEARKREEMKRLNAEAEALDRARAAAIAAARAEAELAQGQILSEATGGESPSPAWLAAAAAAAAAAAREAEKLRRLWSKEEKLEPEVPPPTPAFDMAKWKQQDYAEVERAQERQEALRREEAYQAYRKQEQSTGRTEPAEKPWWEKALDWVDQHQVGIAIGVGVVAAAGAIILTGGAAIPVLAAIAGAGLLSAAGTIGLNAFFDRPLGDNVLRNGGLSLLSGAVTAGAWALATSGLLTKAVIGVGNSLTAYCASNPVTCTRFETGLRLLDSVEEAALVARGTYQSLTGDSAGAADTAFELQLERMDGGLPGNSIAQDLGGEITESLAGHGDEVAEFLLRHGDGGLELVKAYGDEVVEVFERYGDQGVEVVARHGDRGIRLLEVYYDNPDPAQNALALLAEGLPASGQWQDYVPLEFVDSVSEAFDGQPIPITLSEDLVIYRYWSDERAEVGHWATLDSGMSPSDARRFLALPSDNTAREVSEFVVPKETTVLVGVVAGQEAASWAGPYATGGGFQLYLPDLASLAQP